MSQQTQSQVFGAPIQKVLSDSMSMALEGLEVSQAQGKRFLESAFEMGAAQAKDSLKFADEMRGRFAEATNSANEMLKGQASLFNDLAKDPVGASQKVLSGYVEGYRKGVELGAEALKSYVTLANEVWARLEKSSQETRENYVAYVGRLQAIVETTAKKN